MPYVNVPNDLSKIKTKIAFNLTKRQLVCFGGAALVGVPSYLLARGALGNTAALFLMLGIIGEYIGRMILSLNKSPQYVVRETLNVQKTAEEGAEDKR